MPLAVSAYKGEPGPADNREPRLASLGLQICYAAVIFALYPLGRHLVGLSTLGPIYAFSAFFHGFSPKTRLSKAMRTGTP